MALSKELWTWENLWEEITRQVADTIVKDSKLKGAVLIGKKKHPELFQHIAELAAKADLSYIPRVIVVDKLPGGPIWAQKLPNAGASPLRVVLVSEAMMKCTGADLSRRLSPGLEAVMAHEFSHLKDGALHSLHGHFTPFLLPLVAMAGLYLYDRANEKTKPQAGQSKEEYGKALADSVHKVADAEIEKCKCKEREAAKHWHYDPAWQAQIIDAGRYALVAAVTLGAGLLWARQHSLAAEFRADGFAAQHCSPEAMKKVLNDLEGVFKEARKNKPPIDSIGAWVKDKLHWVLNKTVHAHPSLKERVSYIDQVAAERQSVPAAQL